MLTARTTARTSTATRTRTRTNPSLTTIARPSVETARARFTVVANAEDKQPKITRENEKEAWLSEMEREGANPMKDPMAMIGIGGLMVPFVILAIASAAGFIGQ